MDLLNFWYIQLFNRFLEFNFFSKINKIILWKNKSFKIIFQQEFSFPKSFIILQLFNKKLQNNTNFLKSNKKFYFNFINIMPMIQTFNDISILSKQIGIELARTKKHWRVIRGIESIFLQSFIQLKKEPIEGKSSFTGLKIVINGRPNKISRTKRIIFYVGRVKKSTFKKFNVFQTYNTSKAQIGSFGINIIAAT